MSAREIIEGWFSGYADPKARAGLLLSDLTAAGFSIVHEDEIHAPSVEKCARVIDDFEEAVSLRTSARFLIGRSEGNLVGIAYAAALRELMKGVGRG